MIARRRGKSREFIGEAGKLGGGRAGAEAEQAIGHHNYLHIRRLIFIPILITTPDIHPTNHPTIVGHSRCRTTASPCHSSHL
jgi:hypothetical protein